MSHVTGGGLAANLERVMPVELGATLDRGTWALPPVFSLVAEVGGVSRADLEATLNCGVGMVAMMTPDSVDAAVELLAGHGIPAWVAGEVSVGGEGRVTLTGDHR